MRILFSSLVSELEKIGGICGHKQNEPRGLIFWIEFPDLKKLDDWSDRGQLLPPRPLEFVECSLKVILVDDNAMVRSLMMKLLQNANGVPNKVRNLSCTTREALRLIT